MNNFKDQYAFAKSLPPITELNIGKWDEKEILYQYNDLVKGFPFTDLNQINLTVRKEGDADVYAEIGRAHV